MKLRHILAITLTLIATLALLLFLISKYIQPRLSPSVNSDLLLGTAAIVGAAAFLAALKDIIELIERLANFYQSTSSTLAKKPESATNQTTKDSKFNIDAPNSTIGVIGDEANITQHVGSPELASAGNIISVSGNLTSKDEETSLKQELNKQQHNLDRLLAKKRVYDKGQEPLSLLNEIEALQRQMRHIKIRLEELKGSDS